MRQGQVTGLGPHGDSTGGGVLEVSWGIDRVTDGRHVLEVEVKVEVLDHLETLGFGPGCFQGRFDDLFTGHLL